MKAEELVKYLPEKPSKKSEYNLKKEASCTHLSKEYLIFKAELIKVNPSYFELLESDSKAGIKAERVAHCTCTACGGDFHTGWLEADSRSRKGIEIFQGEDGSHYAGVSDEFGVAYTVKYEDGDMLTCPYCGDKVQLLHSSHFAVSKINQVAVSEIVTIKKQTVIMSWLVKREINRLGKSTITFVPYGAVAIIDKKLYSYKHFRSGMFGHTYITDEWYKTSRFTDPTDCIYFDSDAWKNKMKGHIMSSVIPEMKDTSGEKTGLAEYVKKGGQYPNDYLRLWKKYPNIENLIMTGWSDFVLTATLKINEGLQYYLDKLAVLDWKKKKPHEILRMSKGEYKTLASFGWKFEHTVDWCESQKLGLPITAMEFNAQITGGQRMLLPRFCKFVEENRLKASDYKKIIRYLDKQQNLKSSAGLQYLVDHWDMLDAFNRTNGITRELTDEEKFPPNLLNAHEEDIKRNEKVKDQKLQLQFDQIYEMFSAVQWTDGELCVVVPKSESELKKEGATLRHCVGSYGKYHTEKKVIFFIRHYRRPERSYYTLNVDCTGTKPIELQLHGYGNERHGPNKQYSHSIPPKVRAFVDRWEKEVLYPWYRTQVKAKINQKTA
ncbi:MAG: PcfJ domain-containing protein [Clostridia bacterium]|nr:PcfJ domain-containing protein [Clostridia bacterium]